MGTVKEELSQLLRSLSVASTITLSIVFSIFAGVLAGYYLDTKAFDGRTYPWLTIICMAFGIGGGIKNFFIMTKRFSNMKNKGPSENHDKAEGGH